MTAPAPPLSLAEVAAIVGLSAARWRKVWWQWCAERNFPRPFTTPADGGNYRWEAEAVLAWRQGRERALGPVAGAAPAPANDPHPFEHERSGRPGGRIGGAAAARIAHDRHRLQQLMKGARA